MLKRKNLLEKELLTLALVVLCLRLLKQEFSAGHTVDVGIFRVDDGVGSRETLSLQLGERPQQ